MIAYEERQNHLSDKTMVNGVTRNTTNNRNLYTETTSNTGGSDMGVVVNMDPVNPQDIYIDMNTGQEILYMHDGIPVCDDGTVSLIINRLESQIIYTAILFTSFVILSISVREISAVTVFFVMTITTHFIVNFVKRSPLNIFS
jgi:hypothetical protein